MSLWASQAFSSLHSSGSVLMDGDLHRHGGHHDGASTLQIGKKSQPTGECGARAHKDFLFLIDEDFYFEVIDIDKMNQFEVKDRQQITI